MPLKIDVKAGERFVLNNTRMFLTRSGSLIIESKATFLREKDIIEPKDVDTPARAVYYFCQQLYLDESRYAELAPAIKVRCADMVRAGLASREAVLGVANALGAKDFYRALRLARSLLGNDNSIGAEAGRASGMQWRPAIGGADGEPGGQDHV